MNEGVFIPRRLFGTLAHQLQDLDRRIVIMYDLALARLPNQLLEDRFDVLGLGADNTPLGRGRQGSAQALLQPFISIEGHSRAVFQECDHAPDRCIVPWRTRVRRRLGREDLAAEIATQLLQIIHLSLHRRLARKPHQHSGTGGLVNRARFAFRARIARRE